MKKERGFVKAKLIFRGGCFFTTPRYTSIKKYPGINRDKLGCGNLLDDATAIFTSDSGRSILGLSN